MNGSTLVQTAVTTAFFILIAILGFLMKLTCLLMPGPNPGTRWRFILSPFPSPNLEKQCQPLSNWTRMYLAAVLALVCLSIGYTGYWKVEAIHGASEFLRGYLAALFIFLWGYPLLALTNLIWLPTRSLLPPLHDPP